MRPTLIAFGLAAGCAAFAAAGPSLAAKPTAQAAHCTAQANDHKLTGSARTDFLKTCAKGPLAPSRPTAPTNSSQESQAVTKPSGVDRTTRSQQCAAEADRKKLAGKDRKQFQLSCLATAGPVTEGETATKQPAPAKQIKGIGVNNYKPAAATAKSQPAANPPAAAKPQN